mmetsp:Transcript_42101/g.89581  ORF Transcript_42101/g.89581 Transcript_42101/m.89581 type:complete len:220 (-) Transcript_42101:120-779(-)
MAATCMATSVHSSGVPPSISTRTPMRCMCTYAPVVVPSVPRAATLRTWMFSPIFDTRPARTSSRVPPSTDAAMSASTSSPSKSAAVAAACSANLANESSLATKSVSQFTSTRTDRPPEVATAILPSAAMRDAFLSALARPFFRSSSAAASTSPSNSVRTFLQSIMPAPVASRSSLIWAVVTAKREVDCLEVRGTTALGAKAVAMAAVRARAAATFMMDR